MNRFLIFLTLLLSACTMPWDAQVEQARIAEDGRTERAELYVDEARYQAEAAQAFAEGERAKAEAEGYRTLAEQIRADSRAQAIDAFFKAWGWLVALGFVAFALVLGSFVALVAVRPRVVYVLPSGKDYPRLGAGELPDRLFLPVIRKHKQLIEGDSRDGFHS